MIPVYLTLSASFGAICRRSSAGILAAAPGACWRGEFAVGSADIMPAEQPPGRRRYNRRWNQKLKVAIRSMRRLAAEFEKVPLWSALDTSKKREPKIPLGFARFTLLKTLRAETPKLRL